MCSRSSSHQRKKAQRWNSVKSPTVFVDILSSRKLDGLSTKTVSGLMNDWFDDGSISNNRNDGRMTTPSKL